MLFFSMLVLLASPHGPKLFGELESELAHVQAVERAETSGSFDELRSLTSTSSIVAHAALEKLLWDLDDGQEYIGPVPEIAANAWPLIKALRELLLIRRDGMISASELQRFVNSHRRYAAIAVYATDATPSPAVQAALKPSWKDSSHKFLVWSRIRGAEPVGHLQIAKYWVTKSTMMATHYYAVIRMGNRPDFWASRLLTVIKTASLSDDESITAAKTWLFLQRHRVAKSVPPPSEVSRLVPGWANQRPLEPNRAARLTTCRPVRMQLWAK